MEQQKVTALSTERFTVKEAFCGMLWGLVCLNKPGGHRWEQGTTYRRKMKVACPGPRVVRSHKERVQSLQAETKD